MYLPHLESASGYIEIGKSAVWHAYEGLASTDHSPRHSGTFLYQNVRLVDRQTYELSFALSNNSKCGKGSSGKLFYRIAAAGESIERRVNTLLTRFH
jgi:hypothetical protein